LAASSEIYRTRSNASPSFGSGIADVFSLKCSGPSFREGFLDQQDLAIDGVQSWRCSPVVIFGDY